MKQNYINATNLCKIRLAKTILREVTILEEVILSENNKDLKAAMTSLSKIEDRLKFVVVSDEES